MGDFTPTLEDIAIMTILPMFGDVNAMEVILEEEDGVKLIFFFYFSYDYVQDSEKFTYATWLWFFD